MKASFLSVSNVNRYIKNILEEDVLLEAVFVQGEISNFTRHSSGHLYFSLKDEHSSISAVMFSQAARGLKFSPSNGMSVFIYGRIGVYEKQGKYQLYAEVMEDAGKGKLYAMFEALKVKLENKGFFDPARKKPIPANPETVALVTSPTGAAIWDMIRISRKLNPAVHIVVAPCLVQGENAATSIASAIKDVNDWGGAQVIICGRGGGSSEDLWAFNEEIVAEAIFNSKIPVISAVGHETDFVISDFTADLRASTPSAAIAAAVTPSAVRVDRLRELVFRIESAVSNKCSKFKNRLNAVYLSQGFERASWMIEEYSNKLKAARKILDKETAIALNKYQNKLVNITIRLEAASPLRIIDKGYAVVFSEGKTVRDIEQVSIGSEVSVKLSGGSFLAEVTGVERNS